MKLSHSRLLVPFIGPCHTARRINLIYTVSCSIKIAQKFDVRGVSIQFALLEILDRVQGCKRMCGKTVLKWLKPVVGVNSCVPKRNIRVGTGAANMSSIFFFQSLKIDIAREQRLNFFTLVNFRPRIEGSS